MKSCSSKCPFPKDETLFRCILRKCIFVNEYLRQVENIFDNRVEVVKTCVGSKDTVHYAGSEDTIAEMVAGDDVDVGDDNTSVMELAQDCHGASVDDQSDYVTPSKYRGEVVENVFVIIPVFYQHQSLIPKNETPKGDDYDHNFI